MTKLTKLILSIIEKFVRYYSVLISKDLDLEMQIRARKTSADFIEKNLLNTPAFKNKFELLKYSLGICADGGLFMELGVYRGETINFISKYKQNETIYGFDSFDGLPEYWRSGFEEGVFKTEMPKVNKNITLIKGLFSETLPEFIKTKRNKKCSFIHIDSDLYSSARDIFKFLDKNIKKDTVIVFDEFFNYSGWEQGEYKAFYEFIKRRKLKFEFIGYCSKNEQVAVKIL